MANKTYQHDVEFISSHAKVVELSAGGDARVAVVPAFQGRVMTSTAGGGNSPSLGWVNRPFIQAGREDPHFNNYGGEDRFWMGPEAGQFGLWFAKGEPFGLEHVRTPAGFGTGRFAVTSQGKRSIVMVRQFEVANASGTRFVCALRRAVRALTPTQTVEQLGSVIPSGVRMVGFESSNTLANAGREAWTAATGLVSLWVLGQFPGAPLAKVLVPFVSGDGLGPKACLDYFGRVPADRCAVADDHLVFTADGKYRSKIGISPRRARNVLGSFDPDVPALTLVQFNLPGGARRLPYVNSMWETQRDPLAGDAVNSYNDGPAAGGVAPGAGTFYEMETSSPAAALQPGKTINHVHRTFHFAGARDGLRELALRVLGIDLDTIR